MNQDYTMEDLIRKVSNETQYTQKDIRYVVDTMLDIIWDMALEGDSVKLRYVTLGGKYSLPRRCYNWHTGSIEVHKSHLNLVATIGRGFKNTFKQEAMKKKTW